MIGAIFEGLGGAAKGAAPVYGDALNRREDRRQFDLNQQSLERYRGQTLAQDQEQFRYSHALDQAAARREQFRAETERIKLAHEMNRDIMATRTDAVQEDYDNRLYRARRVAEAGGPNASIDQLDRLAKQWGFSDYGQVTGVLQSSGRATPAPGAIPTPGESGLDSLLRIRSTPGFTSFSDAYQYGPTGEPSRAPAGGGGGSNLPPIDPALEEQVLRELGR